MIHELQSMMNGDYLEFITTPKNTFVIVINKQKPDEIVFIEHYVANVPSDIYRLLEQMYNVMLTIVDQSIMDAIEKGINLILAELQS